MTLATLSTPYMSETVEVRKEQYTGNGALALEARTKDGEPCCMLSVNITDPGVAMQSNDLPPDHCYIKNWSENEGILEALEGAGLVKHTGVSAWVGYVSAPLVKVLF